MALDDTKDKIVSVATKLFSRYGFHKTSMDEIAKIARKAKGSLYYHFSGKEELFKEVVSQEMLKLKEQLIVIVEDENKNASDKLKDYLKYRMQGLNDAANYHETIKVDLFEHFHFIDDIRKHMDDWELKSLKKIIQQGIDNKEFTQVEDIDVLTEVLLMTLKGLEIPFYIQGKYVRYAPYFDNLMKMVIKGLA